MATLSIELVENGQALATALRTVLHASGYGGYVVNLKDGAENYYLLVGEGTGETLRYALGRLLRAQ